MKKPFFRWLLATGLALHALSPLAAPNEFSFGVIAHPAQGAADEAVLREAIADTDADNLAFVVANGIKAASEPCSDSVYSRRRALLNSAKNGLIVSLAASDWTECRSANGKSAAIGRLNRLRELFFADELSLGASKIPLTRQSATAKFRSYGENARWEVGDIMFATVNLPDTNNHYRPEAGRNSEFEDRLVANRDWLHRVFTYAARRKMDGIVLFCDGDPITRQNRPGVRRDGFAEARQQLIAHASRFPGKVLIIHGRTAPDSGSSNAITWRGNLGVMKAGAPWVKLKAAPSLPSLFVVEDTAAEAKNSNP
jgi:hypothetical protein